MIFKPIEWLRDATRIHSDGTFEICPELFFQFYVLFVTHGKGENSRILPCGYFLLPGKNEEVYSELFTALKEIIKPSLAPPETPALEPSVALTDFEPAVQNALIDAFPGIDIKGLRHNEDNPVISTNNGYFLPSKSHPNNRLQNSDELEQGDFNNSLDKDGHSTLLSIPLIPKVVAAVFPAIIPQDNSLLYNICYECSETLGNKGMTCVQCKESFHVKCHVLPKYVTITNYYLKAGLKNWKCSRCKPPKSK